jgi:hypothetical protein
MRGSPAGPSISSRRGQRAFLTTFIALAVPGLALGAAAPEPPARVAEPPRPAPPAASPPSLVEQLHRELGNQRSLLLLATRNGLLATTADGAKQKELLPGRFHYVLVDQRGQVAWVSSAKTSAEPKDTFEAIDLTGTTWRPVVVLRSTSSFSPNVGVHYRNPAEKLVMHPDPDLPEELRLILEAGNVRLELRNDACLTHKRGCKKQQQFLACSPDRKCPSLTPEGKALLERVAARSQGRNVELPRPPRKPLPLVNAAIPADETDCCVRCGEAAALPGTKLWTVFTQVYGDCCHIVPQLYDPKTGRFIHPETGERAPKPFNSVWAHFRDAWICAGQDVFVTEGDVATFAAGKVKGLVGRASCLDGGWYFPWKDVPHGCGPCEGCPQ